MKFDLDDLNPGVFFQFKDGDEGGITIRLANAEILDIINKKCTKKRYEFRRGQRHEIIDEDSALRSKMLWDYVIVDWKGVHDGLGGDIECTTENKEILMKKSIIFSTFVGNCVEELSSKFEAEEGLLEKN